MKLRDVRYQITDAGRNSSGYSFEYKDCTVRALAVATGNEYKESHNVMEKLGRIERHGAYNFTNLCPVAIEKLGCKVERYYCDRISVKRFINENPKGSYVVRVSGHAMAVKDAVIFDDHEPRTKRRVLDAWKVIKVQAEEKKYDPINKWDKFFYKELAEV